MARGRFPRMADPSERRFVAAFLEGPALERSLISMCMGAKHDVDPIAHVVLQMLGSHVQVGPP